MSHTSIGKLRTLVGWIVFGIALIVYYFSVERTGSLWDCGEFILGAYKLQVVHPPGAPLYLIIGRIFGWLGEIFSSDPSTIAFMVNLMSGVCSAFMAAFMAWSTMMLGERLLVSRDESPMKMTGVALAVAGLVAGLSSAFITSVWFSAVEGEVYAMSTFFTAMTVWSMVRFYYLPDGPKADRWLVFSFFSVALSVGVHLLSLLTLPTLALLYYFKKYKKHTLLGSGIAIVAGVGLLYFIQKIVIVSVPSLWAFFDRLMVNSFGMPFLSGIVPTLLLLGSLIYAGLWYAHKKGHQLLQYLMIGAFLALIGFSSFGVVVIRANAAPPLNMNNPSDPMRLIPYLNREQYGERSILRGPNFDKLDVERYDQTDRYGRVGDRYEITDYKISPVYRKSSNMLFPRMADNSQGRPNLYREWIEKPKGPTTFADNIKFLWRYQINWMYWRYFMWNFTGRQNGDQGFYSWDKSSGHWLSGIGPIDSARLYNQSDLPDSIAHDPHRNKYFFIPFLLGLLGLIFQYKKNKKDFLAILLLFLITGLGIIIYSNQPPNEPRERDYALVGSFFTYCIWIGIGVLFIFNALAKRLSTKSALGVSTVVGLMSPILLVTQNFDDHSRRHHTGARDYASNFLESCDPNAIIFTYGDNDTYPLWYAQEVEGIRTDVRVVNLSLINVDWYIDLLRRKVNDSAPIKMSIPSEAYRGQKRLQIPVTGNQPMDVRQALAALTKDRNVNPSRKGLAVYGVMPTNRLYLPIDRQRAINTGLIAASDTTFVPQIEMTIGKDLIFRGDMIVLDILAQNIYDRPIYFSVTSQPDRLLGLQDYTQLEGLGLRVIPVKSKSDPNFLIYGSGRIDPDKVLQRIEEKFKWGNFDQYKMYVDRSYSPSTSAIRMIMWRAGEEFIRRGEYGKAERIADAYFKAFPHRNFSYDARTLPFIQMYLQVGNVDKARPHIETIVVETTQHLRFFDSLSQVDRQGSFKRDVDIWNSVIRQLVQVVTQANDPALNERVENAFKPYLGQ